MYKVCKYHTVAEIFVFSIYSYCTSIHIHIWQKNVHKSLICFKVNSKFNVERIMSGLLFPYLSVKTTANMNQITACFE